MENGVSFTYNHAAYPRYRYFQQHFQRLVDRWQKILDAGGLPDCISQGRVKLKQISAAAHEIEDKVKVSVFAEMTFLETRMSELSLQCNKNIPGEIRSLTLTDFIQGDRKEYKPEVTVIVAPSQKDKSLENVKDHLSQLPKSCLKSIIIYFADTKSCFPYQKLVKVDTTTTTKDIGQVDIKTAERCKSLDKKIQYQLEDNVISLLEQIAAYNKPFVPKKQDDSEDCLETAVQLKLTSSLRNPFVVKDLSPDAHDENDDEKSKPTQRELMQISGAIGGNWEVLGPSLGITQAQIDHIKQNYSFETLQIYHMMLLWQQRPRAPKRYLLQVLENVASVIDVEWAVVKQIQEAVSAPKTDFERDQIFHKKLKDFIAKKTKCVLCDKLTQKFGMSSSLINEFLNDGFYGYEKKVQEIMSQMSLPSWPRDKKDNGVSTCRWLSVRCSHALSKMLLETEGYIKAKHEILMLVKKLQFQLFGLLEDTEIEIETIIPEIPKLPVGLQHELLDVSGVDGCGTLWGDLVLHVSNELLPVKRNEVKTLLEKYSYVHGFRTEVIESEQEDVGGFTSIEHGSGIRTTKLNPDVNGNYNFGSLGCFVNVRPKADVASNVVETESKLHGLTCAHLVEGCDTKVDIQHGEGYIELGEKRHVIYEPHSFDVATVEIEKTKAADCETYLKNGNQECCNKWTIFDKPPVRMPVFKYGSATGFTMGTCISNDYETTKMMELWNEMLKKKNQEGVFNPVHNILICREDIQDGIEGIVVGAEASPTEEQEPMQCDSRVTVFSERGDSGSVVCKDDPGNESVTVVSVLLGSVKTSTESFSYSNHLSETVEELQRRFNCIIQPAQ